MTLPQPKSDSTCLVTGASSGIGMEIARELARRGYNLTLTARRFDRLATFADELERDFGVRADPIQCDLRIDGEREMLMERLEERGATVDVLVNNAGLGGAGRLLAVPEERALDMIDTNIRALVWLTRRIATQMVDRGEGAILNVASTAGFQPIPTEAVYSASKAFVLHFGEALSSELSGSGVTCTTLCPGPTATEFAEVAGISDGFDSLPRFVVADAAAVAALGVDAMARGKRLCVPGALNKVSAVAGSKSPRAVVLKTLDAFWPGPRD